MWGFFGGIDSKMSKVEEGSAALIRQQSKRGERDVQGGLGQLYFGLGLHISLACAPGGSAPPEEVPEVARHRRGRSHWVEKEMSKVGWDSFILVWASYLIGMLSRRESATR